MKNFFIFCLFVLPSCCSCQNKSDRVDAFFKKTCKGILLETELSKPQFDTSEAIIIKGIAKNCSKTDSAWFVVVPFGANYCLSFELQQLLGGGTTGIDVFDLGFSNGKIVQPDFKTINRNLAPGERVEVFSFDLKRMKNLPIGGGRSGKLIFLNPGIYEFTWVVAGSFGLSKPAFFEIR